MESLPAWDGPVALVQDHERADDGRDVADEGMGLGGVEAVVMESSGEVVLAKSRGPGGLSPVLDQRQLLWGHQFVQLG